LAETKEREKKGAAFRSRGFAGANRATTPDAALRLCAPENQNQDDGQDRTAIPDG